MRCAFALLAVLIPALAAARGAAPADTCLDARAMQQVRTIDENTLLVAAENGRFVVAHAAGCGGFGPANLLAKDGWVCGFGGEYVQDGEQRCPVRSVTRIDARTYAGLAAGVDGTPHGQPARERRLAPVEVVAGATRRRFRGDASYCFSPGAVRGWQYRGDDIVLQTSPRRAGGHRQYRLELETSCPELEWAQGIQFVSGFGIGMICGNPGDHAVGLSVSAFPEGQNAPSPGAAELHRKLISRCRIAQVYPED